MGYKVTGSYGYKAICDSCQSQFQASELRLRWDGLWVCEKDWETRHPSDFYRTRNDTHKLPFIRVEPDQSLVWTAQSLALLTVTTASGEAQVNNDGQYRLDNLNGLTVGTTFIVQFYDSLTSKLLIDQPKSSTTSAAGTLVLPTTPGGAGNIFIRNSYGEILGNVAVTASSPNVTMPLWTAKAGHISVNFSYIT